jgi:hypothetical protein
MYEEDVATTMVAIEFTGFEVLGTQLSADGSEAEVDSRATFKRLVSCLNGCERRGCQ